MAINSNLNEPPTGGQKLCSQSVLYSCVSKLFSMCGKAPEDEIQTVYALLNEAR